MWVFLYIKKHILKYFARIFCWLSTDLSFLKSELACFWVRFPLQFFLPFFKKILFFYYFQNTPNTKAPLQHQIVLESCPDTDGMVWTGPLVLKRNCFNHKTKEKPLSKKPICGVLKICKIYQAIRLLLKKYSFRNSECCCIFLWRENEMYSDWCL